MCAAVRSFSLDFPINAFPTSRRPPARHTVIEMAADWRDDSLDGFFLQQTTQIDGLRHVRHSVHGFYGGADAERFVADDPTVGVNRWADRGIVGRGVLVDVARHREAQGHPLDHDAGDQISPGLLDETLAAQGTSLEPSDMVLLRTDYPRFCASTRITIRPTAMPGSCRATRCSCGCGTTASR